MEEGDEMSPIAPLLILSTPLIVGTLSAAFALVPRAQDVFRRYEKAFIPFGTGLTLLVVSIYASMVFQGAVFDIPSIAMRLDMTNVAPSIATALIFFLASIYNIKAETGGRLGPELYNFFVLLFMVCMLGLMLFYDLFLVALFIELVIAVSVILVSHAKGKEAVEASFKYLIITAVSALFVILGVLLISTTAQTSNIDEILASPGPLAANPTLVILVAVCFIVGLGADIGIAPFHGWLPDAFPASTPTVNCFFAAEPIALFLALYKLLQPLQTISSSVVLPVLMIGVGLFSLIFGAALAYAQKDFMRMMAYATIEEFGYITIIFGLFTPVSFRVAQLYLMNVSVMKLGMLLCLGSVIIATGHRDMDSLGGLGRSMRLTSVSYLVFVLSLAGIAPLSGFFTKWFLFSTVHEFLFAQAGLALATTLLLVFVATSLFSFIFLIRSFHRIFVGPRKDALKDVKEVPREMWIPAIVTASIIIGFGLMSNLFMAFIT
jgi:formate hydrogenlyase subunit 3/multisubunit Na+/H+ antiporter MnhD subunit